MNFPKRISWLCLELFFHSDLEESLLWRLETLGINRVAVQFALEKPEKRTLLIWLPSHEWFKGIPIRGRNQRDFSISLRVKERVSRPKSTTKRVLQPLGRMLTTRPEKPVRFSVTISVIFIISPLW